MSRKILVVGGGITGRLFQFLHPEAKILDWGSAPSSSKLTRAFGANYLWEPLPGLPCSSVEVVTEIDGREPTQESIAAYKRKIGREGDEAFWGLQFQSHTVGYELSTVPLGEIEWGVRAVEINMDQKRLVVSNGQVLSYDVLVLTIPLYVTLAMLRCEFGKMLSRSIGPLRFEPIYVKVGPRPPDAPYPPSTLYVNYLSDARTPAYRFCDRDGLRHYEGLTAMGTIPTKKLTPGKIFDGKRDAIDRALYTLRHDYGIYCFGRYATWRPKELVHQTFGDMREAGL